MPFPSRQRYSFEQASGDFYRWPYSVTDAGLTGRRRVHEPRRYPQSHLAQPTRLLARPEVGVDRTALDSAVLVPLFLAFEESWPRGVTGEDEGFAAAVEYRSRSCDMDTNCMRRFSSRIRSL